MYTVEAQTKRNEVSRGLIRVLRKLEDESTLPTKELIQRLKKMPTYPEVSDEEWENPAITAEMLIERASQRFDGLLS